MPWDVWSAYVVTVLVLMSTPGPSHLLMISNSLGNGFVRSTATAAGDLTANVLQMLLAGLGVASLLTASPAALVLIQGLGLGYLVWLGLSRIARASRPHAGFTGPARAGLSALWLQGFVTSAANPKAVVFFAALFPQFINPDADFWPQMAVLGGTYLLLDGSFLSVYGILAGLIASRLTPEAWPWIDRASGAFLLATAVLLGLRAFSLQAV